MLSMSSRAADVDTLSVAEHHALWHQMATAGDYNPAFQINRFRTKYSSFEAKYSYNSQNKAVVQEEGDGSQYVGLAVSSYGQFGKYSRIWGDAGYRNGKKRDVVWNSSSDYLLIYPYSMADTAGGDLNNERYTFGGGCATHIGKWVLGESIKFRAEHEYRTADPRPRDIVSDLELMIGLSYGFRKYNVGVSGGGRFYKQTSDVDFYRESGHAPEYQMTGLGSDYYRFSGSNTESYYKASGYKLSVQLEPNDSTNGVFVHAMLSDLPIQKVLTALNYLPTNKLYLTCVKAEAGWSQQNQWGRWKVFADWQNEHRQGDEVIAGNSSTNDYRELDWLTMFTATQQTYRLNGAVEWGQEQDFEVLLSVGRQTYESEYVFPNRTLQFEKMMFQTQAQWQREIGRWLLGADLCLSYYLNTSDQMNMPATLLDAQRQLYVNHLYESAKSDYRMVGLNLHTAWRPEAWKSIGLLGKLNVEKMSADNNSATDFSLSLGVIF